MNIRKFIKDNQKIDLVKLDESVGDRHYLLRGVKRSVKINNDVIECTSNMSLNQSYNWKDSYVKLYKEIVKYFYGI